MADNTTIVVSVGGYQDAIVAAIKASFPDFVVVEFDREETDRDPLEAADLPAILLDLSEFEHAHDDERNDGRLAMHARIEAHIIIGYRTAKAKTAARAAAGTLAAWMRLRRFIGTDCWTEPAQVIGAYRDEFRPGMDRFVVWRVEWSQVVQLGESIYPEVPGKLGTPVYSFAPDIGLGHEDDYSPVIPPGAIPPGSITQ